MKWVLTRLLAGVAAVAVLAVAASALLAHQYSGEPDSSVGGSGSDAAWVGSWEDTGALSALLGTGGIDTLYVHAGRISGDGSVTPVEETASLLSWLDEHHPDVRALAWLRHTADGSSLVEDRFGAEERAELVPAAAELAGDGFDGVHLDVSPVTVNDPSYPALVEEVREELGEDPVLSVRAHHVELVPGGRVPSFVFGGGEKYWSKGYLERVVAQADDVVLPGVDAAMPTGSMYGGFMARQVTQSLDALNRQEGLTVRFGVPVHTSRTWAPVHENEEAETALRAVRLGLGEAGPGADTTVGVALYVADEADREDLDAYTSGWLGNG
ncbi:hypothetical protein [Nocardiopsis kunsanensis]|uniref:Membrane protein n=1 Tax=Nocardiopsis kunsanensis TaxID=141693 RepID=A0A919CEA3_9ACTN|nr:hypothetical protein [Nocardiopsis kunsanensis]GHD14519.1 membrane protein [Nocardiopsis kunsanensis]